MKKLLERIFNEVNFTSTFQGAFFWKNGKGKSID